MINLKFPLYPLNLGTTLGICQNKTEEDLVYLEYLFLYSNFYIRKLVVVRGKLILIALKRFVAITASPFTGFGEFINIYNEA